MARIGIALAAFAGGMISGYLGFLDSGEPWDTRKYVATILRSVLSGILFAVGYEIGEEVGVIDYFYAILGGAGVDVLANRISGKFLGSGSFPVPKVKPNE